MTSAAKFIQVRPDKFDYEERMRCANLAFCEIDGTGSADPHPAATHVVVCYTLIDVRNLPLTCAKKHDVDKIFILFLVKYKN